MEPNDTVEKNLTLNNFSNKISFERRSQEIKINSQNENKKQSILENPKLYLRNSWEPTILKNNEINNKFFPSKDLICKGQNSSNNNQQFNFQHSNSPIVQYYTREFEKFNSPNMENNFYEQNFNIFKRGSNFSNTSFQTFNYSPSNIFNQNNNNNSNNSFIGINNGNTPISNTNNTQYLLNGALRKSLMEKMDNNLDNFIIDYSEENEKEIEEENDDKNNNGKDFLMLTFNSDDECDEVGSNEENEKNLRHLKSENISSNNNLRKGFHMPIASAIKKAIEDKDKKEVNYENIDIQDQNMNNNEVITNFIDYNKDMNNNNNLNKDMNNNNNLNKDMNNNNNLYEDMNNNNNLNKDMNNNNNLNKDMNNNNNLNKDINNKNNLNKDMNNNLYEDINNNNNLNKDMNNNKYLNKNINKNNYNQINYPNMNITQYNNVPTYYQNNVIQQNYYINYNNYPSNENQINPYVKRTNYEKIEKNKFSSLFENNENIKINNKLNKYPKELFSKNKKSKKSKRLDPSEYINIPLSTLSNNFFELGKDQGACRYLQKLLDENPKEVIHYFYYPLLQNILKLINDPFGNYLLQKMFKPMSQDQIKEIINILSPNIYEIGCNSHGTRVLQALIEKLSNKSLKDYYLNIITPFIIPLLKDLNGTHIVQKFAEMYPEYNNFINGIIIENCSILATHRHGCCVIQKYLEILDKEFKIKLIDNLILNCLILITDQFGNYVIQNILLMNNMEYGNKIVEKMTNNIIYYSKHKYSSNVVEKTFEHCNGVVKKNLINIFLKKENLNDLILDEHGNYIIQKVITISDKDRKFYILNYINSISDKLKNVHFGEKLLTKLSMQYPNLFN